MADSAMATYSALLCLPETLNLRERVPIAVYVVMLELKLIEQGDQGFVICHKSEVMTQNPKDTS